MPPVKRLMSGLAVAGLMTVAGPALAHHAVQSEFDVNGRQQDWKGIHQARDGSSMAFLESLSGPDGKTVKIWFGDPNAN